MTRDQSAQVDGAVGADEARRTAAQSSAVARAAVTTRVAGEAVRRAAGATDEGRRARAAVTGDQVRADAAVETRPPSALIYVHLTVGTCMGT